jgi:hypothetical protein
MSRRKSIWPRGIVMSTRIRDHVPAGRSAGICITFKLLVLPCHLCLESVLKVMIMMIENVWVHRRCLELALVRMVSEKVDVNLASLVKELKLNHYNHFQLLVRRARLVVGVVAGVVVAVVPVVPVVIVAEVTARRRISQL